MKRRNSLSSSSSSSSSVWGKLQWNGKKFVYLLLLLFCFTTFLLLQSPYNRLETSQSSPSFSSSSSSSPSVHHNSKIAFMFIARNRLPLDLVWDAFLKGDEEGKFSIYVHSRPGFVLNEATTMSPFFYGRQINQSIQVDWGGSSMIEAERILLKSALNDPFNKRFVFVSDSCTPLYNFSYTYDYIMSSPNSFVDSFSDAKDSRYNPKMHPAVPAQNWRKGSQWVVLIRKHAEVMVNDDTVFPVFQRHCKRKSLPEFWRDHPFNSTYIELKNQVRLKKKKIDIKNEESGGCISKNVDDLVGGDGVTKVS